MLAVMMLRPRLRRPARTVAALLVLVLLGLCLSSIAQAAQPAPMDAPCAARICDMAAGCPGPGLHPVALPLALVSFTVGLAAPAAVAVAPGTVAPGMPPPLPAGPVRLRSPPLPA